MKTRKVKNVYTESDTQLFPWVSLDNQQQIEVIIKESNHLPILIFKHSTRCPISKKVLANFEKEWDFNFNITFYYLDLIQHKDISNEIAEKLDVTHQSPQVILVHQEKVIYQASHSDIKAKTIASIVEKI